MMLPLHLISSLHVFSGVLGLRPPRKGMEFKAQHKAALDNVSIILHLVTFTSWQQLKHSHVPITPYTSYRGRTTKSTVDAAVTLLLFLELSKKHGFWTFCTGTLGGFPRRALIRQRASSICFYYCPESLLSARLLALLLLFLRDEVDGQRDWIDQEKKNRSA